MSNLYDISTSLIRSTALVNSVARTNSEHLDELNALAKNLTQKTNKNILSFKEFSEIDLSSIESNGIKTGGVIRGMLAATLTFAAAMVAASSFGLTASLATIALGAACSIAIGGVIGNLNPTTEDNRSKLIKRYNTYLDKIGQENSRTLIPLNEFEVTLPKTPSILTDKKRPISFPANGVPH